MKLNENYNREHFIEFLNIFLPDFTKDIRKVDIDKLKTLKNARYLGKSKKLNLQVFELTHNVTPESRIALTTDGFRVMRESASFQALVIFYNPEIDEWRLSLMTATPEITDKGKVSIVLSNPRRYSFALGSKAKINTPYNFLIKKGKVNNLDELKERFSVEVVNKEFYKEIAELYTELVGGIRGKGKSKKEYPGLIKLPSVSKDSEINHEFAVRLVGRIIFCWFLREKTSEAGTPLVPFKVLSLDAIREQSNYYHEVLEPLFFEILNKSLKSRKEKFTKKPYNLIPYLNGGLFIPHTDDFYGSIGGKKAVDKKTVVIPDKWLVSLFEILEIYNFTIDENTAVDIDLSIDPEMLGRIFENLLAEINPETGETARKNTGSYYTPREIVNYMIDESLFYYLKSKTEIADDKLRSLITYDLNDDLKYPIDNTEKTKIIKALSTLKLLDPACGSGAFPIGALQKILYILQIIDPEGKLWFKQQIVNVQPEIKRLIEREFKDKNLDYVRKLGIIRNSIFGVDIQPIATEISRLRCFLTLVVDQLVRDKESNRGIEPLPNLDFKFVTANSLIGLNGVQKETQQTGLFEDISGINELRDLRDMFFIASEHEREQLKLQFVQTQNIIFKGLINEGRRGHAELTTDLVTWEPFSNKTSNWFDPEWMFGIKNGFDIVIANPPYISTEKIMEPDKSLYKKHYKKIHVSRIDVYCYFYYRGMELCKIDEGILCYITSNKWLRANYGSKIRKFFSDLNPLHLIDFSSLRVFKSATVNTSVFIVKNSKVESSLKAVRFENDYTKEDDLRRYINSHKTLIKIISSDPWYIGTSKEMVLKAKIEEIGTPLSDWDIIIHRGVITGLNEAFIISGDKKKELTKVNKQSLEIIKPLLRGRDIKRYGYTNSDLYLLKIGYGDYKNLRKKYPSIYKHLLSFEGKLKNRGQCKKTRSGKKISSDFVGQHHWLELDNNPKQSYFDTLDGEKIAWIDLSNKGRFSIVSPGIYLDKTLFFMTGTNLDYLLGVLNSKVINWYFDTICNSSGVGTNLWSKMSLEKLPIPEIVKGDDKAIRIMQFVKQIKSKDFGSPESNKLEKRIDELVYEAYGLTPEEIKIVENY